VSRRWLELTLGLICAIALVTGGVVWRRGAARDQPAPGPFQVARGIPEPAPDFELPSLAGGAVRLAELRGRVVLVNLWATWCEPCRDEMPAMEILARDLGPRGLAVVAVNFKEAEEPIRRFVRDYALTFPVLLDADGAVAARYRAFGLPATYLIDRRGALVGTVLGLRDWTSPEARAYLGELLAPGT
jgi:thiol-disulfide isomerase/thioredoxin